MHTWLDMELMDEFQRPDQCSGRAVAVARGRQQVVILLDQWDRVLKAGFDGGERGRG